MFYHHNIVLEEFLGVGLDPSTLYYRYFMFLGAFREVKCSVFSYK
jgi:hypothetical protein